MTCKVTNISLCHWDGYESETKCSLVKGADIIKNKFGLSMIKIYAGNKFRETYHDCSMIEDEITNLKQLFQTKPYKTVLDMNFKTIVIVTFSICKEGDDYWRTKGISIQEREQFCQLSTFLYTHYPNTEFILSNWESDCVIESTDNIMYRKLYADNITNLINERTKSTLGVSNVKIALEVNRWYDDIESSISYVIPRVNCHMISYSCYQMIYNEHKLDQTIKKIKSLLKPSMELYIGEFGYPTNIDTKDIVIQCIRNNIKVFARNEIRLAFYWNLYCNEKNHNGTFNGFGLITPHGEITYVYKELFQTKPYIITRHGISLSNVWKHNNNTDYLSNPDAERYNLFDSDLTYHGIKTIKENRIGFWNMVFSMNSKYITVYLSPLKRSIRTFFESIYDIDFKYTEHLKHINVYITNIVSEYGDSPENIYKSMEAVNLFPELDGIRSIVNQVNIIDYTEWKPIKEGQYTEQLKTIEHKNDETVIMFSHWGVINHVHGISLSNFGVNNYYFIDYKNKCLHNRLNI